MTQKGKENLNAYGRYFPGRVLALIRVKFMNVYRLVAHFRFLI